MVLIVRLPAYRQLSAVPDLKCIRNVLRETLRLGAGDIRQTNGSSDQVDNSLEWPVATVATTAWLSLFKHRRQAASDQSADPGSPAGQPGWGGCKVSALQKVA